MTGRMLVCAALLAACADPPKPVAQPVPPTVQPDPPPVAALPPPAPTTIHRTVIYDGRPSGTVDTVIDGTTIKIETIIVQNGRGPKTKATIHLTENGTIASLSIKGQHTMGTKVDESFSVEGKAATWKSEEESGEVELDESAFFVPMAAVYGIEGMLIHAALKNGGHMRLLPAGEIRVEKVTEVKLTKDGETRTVEGYYTHGLWLTPSLTWMNPDGTWFGDASDGSSVVPDGWEKSVEPLWVKEKELRRLYFERIATQVAKKPGAAGVAFTHARVLDVVKSKWLTDQTVVVVGDKITAIGPKVAVPAGAEVIDLAGKAIVPGIIDMHAHHSTYDGVLNIASGVTTVRDVGNNPDLLALDMQGFDAGKLVGPRVVPFGFIEGRGEKAASSKITATTPEEAKTAVEYYATRGYAGIKIYNSIPPPLVSVLAKLAHEKGMKVIGHIPAGMRAEEAVRAGYDGIEHINQVMLNFFVTPETDTRDTTRFTLPGEKVAGLDFKSKPVKDFLALLVKKKTLIDPTVSVFEDLYIGVPGQIIPDMAAMVARLPAQVQRGFLQNGLPLSGEKHELYMKSYERMLAFVKLMADSKIPVVLGTDGLAGLLLHHEMAMFVKAGFTPGQVLRIGTIESAKALGLDKEIGTITAGKRADFVVIDGDPLADITAIGKTVTTVRAGVLYDDAKLYAAVNVRPL